MKNNLENIQTEPILVSRFFDIRTRPELNPDEVDFSNIFEDKQYREHIFEEARKAFEFIFDKERFVREIKLEANEESFSYLKQVRRYGLILKALYRFTDTSHKCGEKLNHFLFLLGEYNDSYWISSQPEIREGILDSLSDLDFSVNFIDTEEFKKYAKSILDHIATLVQANNLPIEQFHKLRKRFRLLSNLMQVPAAENCGGNLHWLFYSIFKLSAWLGEIHDDYVERSLKKEIKYEESIVEIGPDVAAEFNKFKPFVEKVLGLK